MIVTRISIQPALPPYRDRKARVYIWPKGETVIENLVAGRRTRPYEVYRSQVLPIVFDVLNLPRDTKARWSQRAGCSCGCSPGFIIEAAHIGEVHVDITDKPYSDRVREITRAATADRGTIQ